MAVWVEDGRDGGLGRFARGWGFSRPAWPLRLLRPSQDDTLGEPGPSAGARIAKSPLAPSLLAPSLLAPAFSALAFPVLAAGALAAQSPGLAALTLGGLAAVNVLLEQFRSGAARTAGLAGLAIACAFALFGLSGAALTLLLWRFMAEISGLHRGLDRLGRAEGMLAGLGVWPLAIAGIASSLLLAGKPFAGNALGGDLLAGAALAWIALGAGALCAAVWVAAKIASWRLAEPFTLRDAYLGLIGITLPALIAGPPDLAVGLSMLAALRLGLHLVSARSLSEQSAAREPQPGRQRSRPVVATIEAR